MRCSEDDDGGDNKMRMGDEVYKGSDEGVEERMESMSDMRDENEERATHWGGDECPIVAQGGQWSMEQGLKSE